MPEPFLNDLLREAPRPRRRPSWVERHGWVIPSGLCYGFAAYAWAVQGEFWTGLGFLLAGGLIGWAFFGSEGR